MKDIKANQAASQAAKIKGYASGGAVMSAASREQSSFPMRRGLGGLGDAPMEGKPAKSRIDRKGSGKGQTTVNVIVAPKGDAAPIGPAAPPIGMMPKISPPMPPPVIAPGGPPTLMGPRAAGGRVKT